LRNPIIYPTLTVVFENWAYELDDAPRRFTENSAAYLTALYDYSAAKAAVGRASWESPQSI